MTLGELVENLGGKLVQGLPELPLESVSSYEEADADCLVFAESAATSSKRSTVTPGQSCCPRTSGRLIRWAKHRGGRTTAALVCQGLQTTKYRSAHRRNRSHRGGSLNGSARRTSRSGATAVIGKDVYIDAGSRIGAGAVLGTAVSIGKDCRIHPRAVPSMAKSNAGRSRCRARGRGTGADGFWLRARFGDWLPVIRN